MTDCCVVCGNILDPNHLFYTLKSEWDDDVKHICLNCIELMIDDLKDAGWKL